MRPIFGVLCLCQGHSVVAAHCEAHLLLHWLLHLATKEVASFHRHQNKMLRAAHFAWSGCTQTGEGALMVFRPSGPTARVRGEGATE